MDAYVQEAVKLVISVIAFGGSIAAAAYAIFKLFAEKWIETRFAERLKTFEHEKTRELERLRLEINSTFSRVAKLHDREFTILPTLWEKLYQADVALRSCKYSFKSYPDLDRLDDAGVDEFLSKTLLSEVDKNKIKNSSNKTTLYGRMATALDVWDARNKFAEFQSFYKLSVPFIFPALRDPIEKLQNAMWNYWVDIQTSEYNTNIGHDGMKKYENAAPPLILIIETQLHNRLYAEVTADVVP